MMIQIKNSNLRGFLVLSFCLSSLSTLAQGPLITKYFDSSWNKTSKDSAFYYTDMLKVESVYQCTSYWMKSKKLNCKSAYADTLFSKPLGLLLRYYENGKMQDSTYFNADGTFKNTYHFYNTGGLWAHYQYNSNTKREVTDAYDLDGKRIDDFIFSREASFQDGNADWQNYLAANIKTTVPIRKGAPVGNYEVVVRFIVGGNGKISDVSAETSLGYGMEEEVIRVIKKSPKWTGAVLMGKPVNAYRRQPITFSVLKDK